MEWCLEFSIFIKLSNTASSSSLRLIKNRGDNVLKIKNQRYIITVKALFLKIKNSFLKLVLVRVHTSTVSIRHSAL